MTLLKQFMVWTAVLLYHRLKMAARRKHRYRLSSSTFCTGVIHKLAYYFNYSIKHITAIVGKNGLNTKQIYKKAMRDSWFYEIESYICKKADNRISNCTTNTPVVTSQLQSTTTASVFDKYCHTVVSVTPPTIDTSQAINDNTNHKLESDKNSQLPHISLTGTTIDNKERSSS